jgi:predicted nucleic acid-binding protein
MAKICVDSGFLIALYDPRDSHHEHAATQFNSFFAPESFRHVLLAPWPILYESLNTRQARRKTMLQQLSADWNILERNEQLFRLNDETYREQALRDYIDVQSDGLRSLSLTDRVIRAVLADPAILIDALLTYNPGDFSDVCGARQIQLIDQHFESMYLQES